MVEEKNEIDEAVERLTRRLRIRYVGRIVLFILIGLIGAYLFYSGLSSSKHIYTTAGVFFMLYAMFMRFQMRKPKDIVDEYLKEIEKARSELKEKEKNQPNS